MIWKQKNQQFELEKQNNTKHQNTHNDELEEKNHLLVLELHNNESLEKEVKDMDTRYKEPKTSHQMLEYESSTKIKNLKVEIGSFSITKQEVNILKTDKIQLNLEITKLREIMKEKDDEINEKDKELTVLRKS